MQTDLLGTKRVTIDDLARMVAKGFREVDEKISEIRREMATKEDIKDMATKQDIRRLEEGILKNHGFRLRKIEEKLEMA